MEKFELKTKNGYLLSEVVSALQKSIRRADAKTAGYFALEMFHSGYWKYVWKRLYTVSAEDCHGIITKEIHALFNGFLLINGSKNYTRGRIFISKAVIILCQCKKSRDADHLQNLLYDQNIPTKQEIESFLKTVNPCEIPDYAYDVHTTKGKIRNKTKHDFFIDEFIALTPRQPGLFDNLIKV